MPSAFRSGLAPVALLTFAATLFAGNRAASQERVQRLVPRGSEMVRMLGAQAAPTLAPGSGRLGALVSVPSGVAPQSLGLDEVAPGIGRLRGSPQSVIAFGDAHPDLHMEIAPPLKLLLDKAGSAVKVKFVQFVYNLRGENVVVGIADTGLDVGHPDFLDENAHTRVAWMLDLSRAPVGKYPELEDKFGIKDDNGKLIGGAVFSGDDLDVMMLTGQKGPEDEVGHGTHVASLAAGNGGNGGKGPYIGMAPKAKLVIARVTRTGVESIENDDLLRGAQFIFDRADSMKLPAVANLSLGSDFGPHDGSMLWEQTLASYVGPDKPGHVLVAAAGNSGSVASAATHQTVRVTSGTRMRVPVDTAGASAGGVQIWVTLRRGGKMAVGLDAPNETWISPVEEGEKRGKNGGEFNAGVLFGAVAESPVPANTRGAVVLWSGKWPEGRYYVTLEGEGLADLYLQATGDAQLRPAAFAGGVREGTVNLPATHPSIIAVGCTATRTKWTSIAKQPSGLVVPVLDSQGGFFAGGVRDLEDGEICWFSGAGPNADGVPKPDIVAPGAAIIGAMSRQAVGNKESIFTTPNCPEIPDTGQVDPRCLQIDKYHAVSVGTSMSSPIVAGGAALLLQRDPTLTQDKVLALLQAGAHRIRGSAPYDDQAGPGELDIIGSLYVMDQIAAKGSQVPSYERSWVTLSSEYAVADGSRAITAIIELRAEDTAEKYRPDLFEAARLQALVLLDGHAVSPQPTVKRHGPGVFSYTFTPPAGSGGSVLSFGATFDGGQIVAPKTISIATDPWLARYPFRVGGGCATSPRALVAPSVGGGVLTAAGVVLLIRRRRRRS